MTIALSLLGWLLVAISCALRFGRFMGNQKRAAQTHSRSARR